jgi:hypothetical protein
VSAKKTKSATLIGDQIEIIGQFNDYSFENPKEDCAKRMRARFVSMLSRKSLATTKRLTPQSKVLPSFRPKAKRESRSRFLSISL